MRDTVAKTGISAPTIRRQVQIAKNIADDVKEQIKDTPLADNQSELLNLARQTPEQQRETVAAKLGTAKQPEEPEQEEGSTFNRTNDNIEWAAWSWNPVSGCLNACKYCYARDIAKRFYPKEIGFNPHFYPERLSAPQSAKVPAAARDNVGERNVFTCSMGDLFGVWIPNPWIEAVLDAVRKAPQWNFLFLTKNPQRLLEFDWPANAWVGATVDTQARVAMAEEVFRHLNAPVKFLSCEPLLEELTFSDLSVFHWVIIGAQSKTSGAPEVQPQWRWVESLLWQARQAGCQVYLKPNLTARPREYPCSA